MSLWGGAYGSCERESPLRTEVPSLCTRFDKWSPPATISGDVLEESLATSVVTTKRGEAVQERGDAKHRASRAEHRILWVELWIENLRFPLLTRAIMSFHRC